ncbi:hypothetical protein G5B38_06280 [Pseudohalocynthiibacter aestuariivivens]|uniref:PH domain-containing protein n=1 Tax=Roseovarius pelagicus TaxID=2980108 RepID=A0ABY6D9W0_9RHOB|nr:MULTISPECIES: hypothetical protein [Rhodobacterales]QIE45166.1 hypothetical protein G5B38_06280 [Pseudohalocynthiibacter aestuariivivens]UXX82897.1 hypothetical protein N7U68_17700 [Roseovarius pelagicus]
MQDDVLIIVHASAPRRIFAVGTLLVLGVIVLYLAIARPPQDFGLQAFLIGFGLIVLWLTERLRRATRSTLVLTETQLRTDSGEVLAEVAQIESLDRGFFAFKPSNGFLVRLTHKAPYRWEPGMWWRHGRRIGVGGVAAAAQTKAMAEMLSAMIAQRD